MNLFVCGRVCLFGEHSDWAANYIGQNEDVTTGKALVVGLNQGIYADAVKDDKFIININCEVAGENHFEEDMSLPKLK